ncbi:hypothetical protein KLP28_17190 [Nocardioidaceae bacterium]|nr:hypothetical protein KLP28_17190 [Nocardioidaceae bacterium]
MKPSQQYAEDARLIMEFRNTFVELANQAQAKEGQFFLPELGPRPGVGWEEWNRLRGEVARAAGAAASAYNRYGGKYTLRNAAYITNNVDPVANWDMCLKDPEGFSPTMVISAVDSAIGRARQQSEQAARRERGLVGLIAAFLRWPATLREAVGPSAVQRRTASAIGIAGQIIVGVIASLIATGLAALLVLSWRSWF